VGQAKLRKAEIEQLKKNKFSKPTDSIYVNESLVSWLDSIKRALQNFTDWQEGYEATELGSQAIHALLIRNHQHRPQDSQPLLRDLVAYRDMIERTMSWKLQMDSDQLRYNKSSPKEVKYTLGVLDSIIGGAMFAFGNATIQHIDCGQFVA
jgi:hypothetical protein